jgi:pyruvate dehydrogenase E2 component (dihydrolipoamide acetyltransferase)
MATEFKLPTLGENVSAGTIAKVLIAKGDTVQENQTVIEIETDKAVAEIPSSVSGKVLEVKVKEGQSIKAGAVVFTYEAGAAGEAKSAPAPNAQPETSPTAAPTAAQRSAPAPAPKLHVLERPAAPAPAPAAARAAGATVVAAPSIRRMARELGVDIHDVPTADPSGRLTAQDVQAYAQGLQGGTAAAPAGNAPTAGGNTAPAPQPREQAAAPAPVGDLEQDQWGNVAREPMNGIRKKTVEFMTQCWTTIPHVTHFEKADVTDIETLRQKQGKKLEAQGVKLTVTSFVLKVLAEALKKHPKFNSSIDLDGQAVLLKQYYHIGVAVDTPNGLLVPVLRNVDQLSVRDISIQLPQLAEKARNRKLALEDMQGGTFTVSNLGGLGGYGFTPIIAAPQVAILGMSRSQVEPVLVNGQFVPRTMLPLSLSYDHRVIDGADAARFMRWVCETLEQPWSLFLD